MLLALLVILGVAVDDADGQWATSSFGYAASSVDAYIYGSGTTLFNGVSSNSPSYAPPAPTPATCASRGSRARCEDVALYDSDGLYCSWEGGACRGYVLEEATRSALTWRCLWGEFSGTYTKYGLQRASTFEKPSWIYITYTVWIPANEPRLPGTQSP